MEIKIAEIITWLIVGALAGWLAGMIVKRRKEGFGRLTNFGVGLVGATIGGVLFKLFRINIQVLSEVTISLQEIVAAILGALLFLAIVWIVQFFRSRNKGP